MTRILLLFLAIVLSCSSTLFAKDVDALLADIRQNYAQIATFEAVTRRTALDASGKTVFEQTLLTAGDASRLKCSLIDTSTTFEYFRDGPTWYRYTPGVNSYVVGPIDQMPSLLSLDPREAGSPGIQSPLLDAIDKGVLVAQSPYVLRLPAPSGRAADQWFLQLSDTSPHLPVKSSFVLGQRKYLEIEVEYATIPLGKFPQTVTSSFFDLQTGALRQRLVDRVTLKTSGPHAVVANSLMPPPVPAGVSVTRFEATPDVRSWLPLASLLALALPVLIVAFCFLLRKTLRLRKTARRPS